MCHCLEFLHNFAYPICSSVVVNLFSGVAPIVCGCSVLGLRFVNVVISVLSSFINQLAKEAKAGFLTLTMFLLS